MSRVPPSHEKSSGPEKKVPEPDLARPGGSQIKRSLRGLPYSEQVSMLSPVQAEGGFDTLTGKAIAEDAAPENVTLPEAYSKGMQTAWDGSLPDGKSQEQGGILVRNADDSYEWKAGKAGKAGSFALNYGDVGPGETLVGSGHTHPYGSNDGSLDGATGVTFSGGDLGNMVTQKERVKVVQSGQKRFMVSKTKEWDGLVAAANTVDKKRKLSKDIKTLWSTTFKGGKGTFQENCEQAVKAVCNKYHLVYYTGEGKELAKVETGDG